MSKIEIRMTEGPEKAGQLLSFCPGKPSYDLYLAAVLLDMSPCIFTDVIEAWK